MRKGCVVLLAVVGACGDESSVPGLPGTTAPEPERQPPVPVATLTNPRTTPVAGGRVQVGPWSVQRFVDFPTVRSDCGTRVRTVALSHRSDGPQTVEILGIDPPFYLHPATPTLMEVAAGQTLRLEVLAPRLRDGLYRGRLPLRVEGDGDVDVQLSAEVRVDHEVQDMFRGLGPPQLDVLFVLDDSETMADESLAILLNLQAYMQLQLSRGADLRMAFVNGEGVVSLLRPDPDRAWWRLNEASELLKALALFLEPRPGFRRSLLEGAHDAVKNLTLRQGAVFDVVFVSDGDDRSPGAVDGWSDVLRAAKGFGSGAQVALSVVAGGRSCPGLAAPSPRLAYVAQRGRGVFQPICTTDWSQGLEDLHARRVGTRGPFRLSQAPRLDSLQVILPSGVLPRESAEGVVNWTYDSSDQALKLSPTVPLPPSAEVTVRYLSSCR